MNKNRKFQKSYREMAKEAGVSVGMISKCVKVQELGRSQEVIDGKKTVDEVLREEGLMPQPKKKKTALARCIETLPKLTLTELGTLYDAIHNEVESRD